MRHELIGSNVKVRNSNNLDYNFSGRIVDESRNTFIIEKKGKQKIIIKKDVDFIFSLGKYDVKVAGKTLLGRSEDRVKNRIKKRW
jgi:ribonuclease P protein subunit POP4